MKRKILIIAMIFVLILCGLFWFFNKKNVYNKMLTQFDFVTKYILDDVDLSKIDINKNIEMTGTSYVEYERFVIHGSPYTFKNDYKYSFIISSKELLGVLSFSDEKNNLEIVDEFDLSKIKVFFELLQVNDKLNYKIEYEGIFNKVKKFTAYNDKINIKYEKKKYTIKYEDLNIIINYKKNNYVISINENFIISRSQTNDKNKKFYITYNGINATILIADKIKIQILDNLSIETTFQKKYYEGNLKYSVTKNKERLYYDVPAYKFYLTNIKNKLEEN